MKNKRNGLCPSDRRWRNEHIHQCRQEHGKEDIAKRSRNGKVFKLGKNIRQFVLYPEPVHFKDKNDNWQEIDNQLVESRNCEDALVFTNRENELHVEFAQNTNISPLICMMDTENRKLAWDLVGANTNVEAVLMKSNELLVDDEDAQRAALGKVESTLCYSDIYPDVDLICRLQGTHFKDDIVLKNNQAKHEFEFNLRCDGVRLALKDDGCIIAHSLLMEDQRVFTLPAAFMRDNEGNIGSVQTQLIENEDGYRMILTCDEEFLSDAAFPVVLDPLVKTEEHSSAMEDNYVTSLSPDTVQSYSQGRLRVCKNNSYGECRSFLKWTKLPALDASDVITKAYLRMSLYSNMGTQDVPVHLKEVTGDWSSQTITWNNQPTTSDYDSDCVIIPANAATGSSFAFDISNLVRKWYTNNNYGVMFERRITTTPNTVDFVSSDSVYNKPVVMINYISCAGLEDYMTFDTIECGRAATGHVNLFNGNVVVERKLTSCSGSRMPVSVSMYYSPDMYSGLYNLGRRWRLNYDQTVTPETIGDTTYYKYTQGDGTDHYFALESGNTYKDMSGLSLTMTVSAAEILIESKDGMQWHFEPVPDDLDSYSYLLSINDPCGNTITITYTENHDIYKITDGAGRETVFTNNEYGDLVAILAPGETTPVTIEYNGTLISGIVDGDGVRTNLYWDYSLNHYGYSNPYLSSIGGPDGRYLSITYPFTAPKRTLEMGILYPDGEALYAGTYHKYEYNDCQTTVIDATVENGKRLLYQFNDYGNLVSVRDELGYASYTKFSEELLPNHPKQMSKLQRSVINLLPNHDFELSGYWSNVCYYNGAATFTYDTNEKYMGTRSMKVNKTNAEGNACLKMSYNQLEVGKMYTLSAYMYCEGDVYCYATVSQGKWYDGEKFEPVIGWNRIFTTFTATSTSATLYFITMGGPGTVWLDCAQLEEGAVVNRYNMIRNGDFSQNNSGVPTFWYANGVNTSDDAVVATTDILHPAFLSGNVMRLYGEPQTNKGFYQDLPLSGSEGDVYVIGGWAKGYSCPIRDNPRHFGIRVAFKNSAGTRVNTDALNWNEEWTEWQYISGAVIAPCDYTEIRFNVDYEKNLNYADFDGFTLYKEEFGNTFAYDEDGNVTAVKNLAKKQAKAEYDDYNNLISYVQPGRADNIKTLIDYGSTDAEKKKRLPLSVDSPTNIRTKNFYDNHGNVIRTYTIDAMDGTQVIDSYQSHTSDGNHVATKTDSRGKVVTYTHNLAKDTLTSVTDPNGQSINYTYDSSKRVTAATATVDGNAYKNTYTYENDRLKTVSHNTTGSTPDVVYAFAYDHFGKPTTVHIGNQVLSTNIYTATGDRTLTDVEYGNGGKVHYIHDDFRRVKGLQYDAATTPRFTYEYGANGQIAYIRDNELNRTIWTEYDTSERPIKTHVLEGAHSSSLGTPMYLTKTIYDEFGNVQELIEIVNDERGYETYINYDVENRPTEMQYGDPNRKLTYTYDRIGRISERSVKNSHTAYTTTYSYLAPENGDGILTTPLVASITQNGQNFSYTYDNVGNIASVTRNGLMTTYEYDKLGQLKRVNDPHANKTTVYEYDFGGNIKSYSEYAYTTGTLGTATATIQYLYGDGNWKDKVTSIGGKAITYDAIGNPLTYDGWTYTWKAGRMLASMSKTNTTVQFAYDHNGLRVQKTVNGVVTKYMLNGKRIVNLKQGDHDLHFFYDAQGKPAMIRYNGVSDYYFVYNLQGDVVAIVDDAGTQMVEYQYDAWGVLLGKSGSLKDTIGTLNPFRYRGYVYDEETGLYCLRSRYYNPEWKRLINADRFIVTRKGICGNNVFAYCGNNPINRIDTAGMFFSSILNTLSNAWSSIKEWAANTFGAGATAEYTLMENAETKTYLMGTVTNGERITETVSETGNSSKPLSLYYEKDLNNPFTSSGGMRINFDQASTLEVSVGLDDTGFSYSTSKDSVSTEVGFTVNWTEFEIEFEKSVTIEKGNSAHTAYQNVGVNGTSLAVMLLLRSLGVPIPDVFFVK